MISPTEERTRLFFDGRTKEAAMDLDGHVSDEDDRTTGRGRERRAGRRRRCREPTDTETGSTTAAGRCDGDGATRFSARQGRSGRCAIALPLTPSPENAPPLRNPSIRMPNLTGHKRCLPLPRSATADPARRPSATDPNSNGRRRQSQTPPTRPTTAQYRSCSCHAATRKLNNTSAGTLTEYLVFFVAQLRTSRYGNRRSSISSTVYATLPRMQIPTRRTNNCTLASYQ